MHHIVLIDMCELRKHIQTNILFEMSVNVPAHRGALLAGPASGRRHSERKIGMPQDTDQKDLQQVLANHLVPRRLGLDLPEHGPEIKEHLLPAAPEMDDLIGGVCRPVRTELQSLHPQDDILQWAGVEADLGVLHIGVDDDQIIRSHRQHPPGHLELPHPANYIKKFRTGMGVQQAVPVSSIFGRAHVQELGGGAVNGAGDPSRELITVVTHGRTPVQALGFLRLKLKLAAF